MRGYAIHASDGNIGEIYDVYFDDESWSVRYVVVETGNWLFNRRVLLSSSVFGRPDQESQAFPVSLSRRQVQESPDVDLNLPISRRKERELHIHYGWPAYWAGGPVMPIGSPMIGDLEPETGESVAVAQEVETNLRSMREIVGYHIQASDGEIGHIQDFIVDDETWDIRYAVVDTRNWWIGKEVLIAPQWIQKVDWDMQKVFVDLTRESIRNSPEYENLNTISRDYEEKLYEYYKRRSYWK
jgi:sporulation protein YlmC with PRC-barrel domain